MPTDIIREFNEVLESNPANFDKEYLAQLRLEIISCGPEGDWWAMRCKLYGFNYEDEPTTHTVHAPAKNQLAKSLYQQIVEGTDLMRKDKRIRELMDRAAKEAERRYNRFRFWNWFIPKSKRRYPIGWCHWYWREQKRILKEKHNIDWPTPAEKNPSTRFD